SVGGGVDADETHAAVNGVEEGLLALRRHGRILVRAGLGEVTGGEEDEGVVFANVVGVEDAAVFGGGEVEAIVGGDFAKGGFGDAGLVIGNFDDLVLEAG